MDVMITSDSIFGVKWARAAKQFQQDPNELAQKVLEEFMACLGGRRPGGLLTRALFEVVKGTD